MIQAVRLEGEFVTLRPLTVADAALSFAWRQSQRAKLLNPGAATVADQERWIAARPESEYNFIIETKDGRAVGMLSVTGIDQANRRAEPGRFLIGDEAAVRGIPAAVEAIKLLYQFIFDRLELLRVWGFIASDNHMMIKWQKYFGMKEEGRLRNQYFINGRFQDAVMLGLLVDEYRQVSLPRFNAMINAARPR